MSTIQNFYKNQVVFITGGTGFLGKVLLEKLLRSTEVQTIYLLIREKKNKSAQQRLQDMLQCELFKNYHNQAESKNKLAISKITVVSGDCCLPALGLSEANRNLLLNNVNIIFHCAATVRYMEPLGQALRINLNSTQAMLELSKQMPYLKSFVHVSTAFVHCARPLGDECIISEMAGGLSGANACKLIEIMDDKLLDKMTPQLLGSYPNTYIYTKSLAENVIATQAQDVPICVFRPVCVASTYCEPIPGWMDNLYGPLGFLLSIIIGHMHVMRLPHSGMAQVVPVNYCVNTLLACGYYTSQQPRDLETTPTVFNLSPVSTNSITWREYIDIALEYTKERSPKNLLWYPFVILIESTILRQPLRTLLHTIPAFFVDLLASYNGEKLRLSTIYKRLHKVNDESDCYSMKRFQTTNNNVRHLWDNLSEQDKQLFPFDMQQVNWKQLQADTVFGLKRYMLKEEPDNFEAGRRRYRKKLCLHSLVSLGVLGTPIFSLLYLVLRS